MSAATIASEIIGALTSGLTGLVSAIPTAIKDSFMNLFTDGEGTTGDPYHVSTFAIVMLVFGGVALAFGLSRLVYNLIANKIGA